MVDIYSVDDVTYWIEVEEAQLRVQEFILLQSLNEGISQAHK